MTQGSTATKGDVLVLVGTLKGAFILSSERGVPRFLRPSKRWDRLRSSQADDLGTDSAA